MPRPSISAILLIAVLATAFAPGILQLRAASGHAVESDFPSFYFAAVAAFRDGLSPYDFRYFDMYARQEHFAVPPWPFLYPPIGLLPVAWMSWLSLADASAVLAWGNVTLLVGATGLLIWRFRATKTLPFAALAGIFLLNHYGISSTIYVGQTNLFSVAALVAAWLSLRKERPAAWVAVPLTFAIALKVYNILFIPYLVCRRRFREAAFTTGFLCVAFLVSLFVTIPGTWGDWLFDVLPGGVYFGHPKNLFSSDSLSNQSLNGVFGRWRRLLPEDVAGNWLWASLPYCLAILVVVATLWAARKSAAREDPTGSPAFLDFWLVPLATFLIAPLSWLHHLAFAAPAALLTFYALLTAPRRPLSWGGRIWTSLGLLAAVGTGLDLAAWLPHFLARQATFFAVLALWVWHVQFSVKKSAAAAAVVAAEKARRDDAQIARGFRSAA